MRNWRIEAIILAVGMIVLGIFVKSGITSFAERDRSVNVKGLAEEGILSSDGGMMK